MASQLDAPAGVAGLSISRCAGNTGNRMSDQVTSFPCELISWQTVDRLAGKLADKIRRDGFTPDIVITIARGGFVPARIICDQLDLYNLASIQIAHYTGGSTRQSQARLAIPLTVDIKDMQVLLIDDVDDSGDTLQLAVEHINSRQPAVLKTAVLHHKQISTLTPDYHAVTLRKWRWIIYPWAVREDICGFIRKLTPPPQNQTEILQRLRQDYGISLSARALRKILPEH